MREAFASYVSPIKSLQLPTAPERLLCVEDDDRFPQSRKHAMLERGMSVAIGRIRQCEVLDVKFVVLVNNTLRGAAGNAVLNAELLHATGLLKPQEVGCS